MARPVVHDESLRQSLLAVTADLVDREGPARVTVRDVASAAGTSTTAVYTLFGSKSELLQEVVEAGFRSFHASQLAAASEGLLGLGKAYRAWALDHQALYRLMFGGALAAYVVCEPDVGLVAEAMVPLGEAIIAAQLAHPQPAGDAQMLGTVMWGQVHGLVSLELSQVGSPETDWEEVYSLALAHVSKLWGLAY